MPPPVPPPCGQPAGVWLCPSSPERRSLPASPLPSPPLLGAHTAGSSQERRGDRSGDGPASQSPRSFLSRPANHPELPSLNAAATRGDPRPSHLRVVVVSKAFREGVVIDLQLRDLGQEESKVKSSSSRKTTTTNSIRETNRYLKALSFNWGGYSLPPYASIEKAVDFKGGTYPSPRLMDNRNLKYNFGQLKLAPTLRGLLLLFFWRGQQCKQPIETTRQGPDPVHLSLGLNPPPLPAKHAEDRGLKGRVTPGHVADTAGSNF